MGLNEVSCRQSNWQLTQFEESGNEVERSVQAADGTHPLEVALANVRREVKPASRTTFWIVSVGKAGKLRPIIQQEVYWIGREALVNAFRHSGASRVQLEIAYTSRGLRLAVCDNGKGVPPEMLARCDGRNGLFAMRARAEKIGGKIKLSSRIAGGTELELTIPNNVAFEPQARSSRTSLVSFFSRTSTNTLREKQQ